MLSPQAFGFGGPRRTLVLKSGDYVSTIPQKADTLCSDIAGSIDVSVVLGSAVGAYPMPGS